MRVHWDTSPTTKHKASSVHSQHCSLSSPLLLRPISSRVPHPFDRLVGSVLLEVEHTPFPPLCSSRPPPALMRENWAGLEIHIDTQSLVPLDCNMLDLDPAEKRVPIRVVGLLLVALLDALPLGFLPLVHIAAVVDKPLVELDALAALQPAVAPSTAGGIVLGLGIVVAWDGLVGPDAQLLEEFGFDIDRLEELGNRLVPVMDIEPVVGPVVGGKHFVGQPCGDRLVTPE